ncbi:MAG: hypothetical protein II698_01325 [Ruminococcus sp.]|nr:hypothetical protein [Ruminococcus sp.]
MIRPHAKVIAPNMKYFSSALPSMKLAMGKKNSPKKHTRTNSSTDGEPSKALLFLLSVFY